MLYWDLSLKPRLAYALFNHCVLAGVQRRVWESHWESRTSRRGQTTRLQLDRFHHILGVYLHLKRSVRARQAHLHFPDGIPGKAHFYKLNRVKSNYCLSSCNCKCQWCLPSVAHYMTQLLPCGGVWGLGLVTGAAEVQVNKIRRLKKVIHDAAII